CGLPYYIGGIIPDINKLIVLDSEKAKSKKGIDVRTKCEVVFIDKNNKKIKVKNFNNLKMEEYTYDKLIIATGATPVQPEIKGIQNDLVFYLRNLEDGIRLKKFIYDKRPKRVIIIGEGHIALEMVENFKLCGINEIYMIIHGSHVCWWLDSDMAEIIERKLIEENIKLIKNARVDSIERYGQNLIVKIGNDKIVTDFIFVSRGMKPNTQLAKEAGLKLGMRGAIEVNNFMETSHPDIYAAGDCATVYNIIEKRLIYMPRGTTANKQGKYAGMNAAGKKMEFKGITASMAFKVFNLEVSRAGIWDEEAQKKNIEYKSKLIKSITRASYYPRSGEIFIKLTADLKTHKLLGAQIIGEEGVAKRMDIISTALYNEMTIDEMRHLDFCYSPPFCPVWEPVHVAINQLYKELNN
ncbi:MAG: FAD-dependent oxidoreductase, partial [Candidatus Goldbacteria bacterium]|nr:FAD-dependent oxidoreductase [Candidatus Goldiibacteriota bacterium]